MSYEMYTAEGNRVVHAAMVTWFDMLRRGAFATGAQAIERLDQMLDEVVVQHPEIKDTEPRETLAYHVEGALEDCGLDPRTAQQSRYAASLWHPREESRNG